jgi:hypothetical protein
MAVKAITVTFHQDRWQLESEGHLFGSYLDPSAAREAALGLARDVSDRTRVVIREASGSETTVWDPLLLT